MCAENAQCRSAICLTTVSRVFLARAIIKPCTFPWKGLQPLKSLLSWQLFDTKVFNTLASQLQGFLLKIQCSRMCKFHQDLVISQNLEFISLRHRRHQETSICLPEILNNTSMQHLKYTWEESSTSFPLPRSPPANVFCIKTGFFSPFVTYYFSRLLSQNGEGRETIT